MSKLDYGRGRWSARPGKTALLPVAPPGGPAADRAVHHLRAAARAAAAWTPGRFMVFDDLVRDERFDLWVGDEAWDIDYFLHENPELKRAHYAWMTNFVGWLPMPDGGTAEQDLTTDYNAEMIEQIARFPSLRDRSVFVGNPAACLDYEQTTPEVLASAMAEEISRPVSYRPVETDGAARAAACLAELI